MFPDASTFSHKKDRHNKNEQKFPSFSFPLSSLLQRGGSQQKEIIGF